MHSLDLIPSFVFTNVFRKFNPVTTEAIQQRFTFKNPPTGIQVRQLEDGILAWTSVKSFTLDFLFQLFLQFVLLALLVLVISIVFNVYLPLVTAPIISAVCILILLACKDEFRLKGEWIHYRRSFLKIGYGRKIHLQSVKQVSITATEAISDQRTGRFWGVSLPKICIKTQVATHEIGGHLRHDHREYFYYLIRESSKNWKLKR